jgi:hypothetical protein
VNICIIKLSVGNVRQLVRILFHIEMAGIKYYKDKANDICTHIVYTHIVHTLTFSVGVGSMHVGRSHTKRECVYNVCRHNAYTNNTSLRIKLAG